MKPKLLIVSLVLGLTALFSSVGCNSTKVAPAGAYHGDSVLYSADLTLTSSYTVLDTFLTWEYTNRAALAGNPGITKAADNIRTNAKHWFSSAEALRDAYAASPTSTGV